MPAFVLNGGEVPYTIYRRKGNKNVRISITRNGGVRVSVPMRYPNKYIPGLLDRYADWISDRLSESHVQTTVPALSFVDGAPLLFLGKEYRLQYSYHTHANAALILEDETAHLKLPQDYERAPNREGIETFILGWYRYQAQRYLVRRTEQWAEAMGLHFAAIRLKDVRSRWGSCSAQKNLNFNIRLMMLPKRVVDYVIVHELAHLRELNHSPAFWRIVGKYCPAYKEMRNELKGYGMLLGE